LNVPVLCARSTFVNSYFRRGAESINSGVDPKPVQIAFEIIPDVAATWLLAHAEALGEGR
jgi:hypothetical protein